MTQTLAHRGPDGSGLWVGPGCGFGHRRLSIVDVAGGAQPMSDPTGGTVVCFNGEIYNHLSLRRELGWHGHVFSTASDTESLVEGSRRWGSGLASRLNGMFAYGAWDVAAKRGVVARDRFGEKPLYYAHLEDGTLLFASELRALLEHPGVGRRIDAEAIASFLTYEYVPWPLSAVRGVRKLEPGTQLIWQGGRLTQERFGEVGFGPSPVGGADEWVEATRAALLASVKRRLMADVPLGVFLSGGVDSSAIAALTTEHVPAAEVHTFSIAFEDPSFDESRWARLVASRLGTQHHERTFTEADLLAVARTMFEHMDEPFADASLLPTHLLSRFTRDHVKVALGGDGGDELFLGYETFRADSAARLYGRLPGPVQRAAEKGAMMLPVSTSNFSLDFVAKSFVRGAAADGAERHVRWLSAFLPGAEDDPLLPELRAAVPHASILGVMERPYADGAGLSHAQRLSRAYVRTYLAEDILTKVDRASMAAGLEARSAFLDPELARLAATMPASLKLRGGFGAKWALKRAVRGLVPDEVLRRKKKGFGIPVARWLNGPLAPWVDEVLAPERLADGGLLSVPVVTRLIAEHRSGRVDRRKQLWTLLALESWRRRWGMAL